MSLWLDNPYATANDQNDTSSTGNIIARKFKKFRLSRKTESKELMSKSTKSIRNLPISNPINVTTTNINTPLRNLSIKSSISDIPTVAKSISFNTTAPSTPKTEHSSFNDSISTKESMATEYSSPEETYVLDSDAESSYNDKFIYIQSPPPIPLSFSGTNTRTIKKLSVQSNFNLQEEELIENSLKMRKFKIDDIEEFECSLMPNDEELVGIIKDDDDIYKNDQTSEPIDFFDDIRLDDDSSLLDITIFT